MHVKSRLILTVLVIIKIFKYAGVLCSFFYEHHNTNVFSLTSQIQGKKKAKVFNAFECFIVQIDLHIHVIKMLLTKLDK